MFQSYLMSELITAIILFIITGFAYVYTSDSNSELERTKSTEDLTILYECVKKYKSEIGTYPKKLEDLTVTKDGYGPWIEKIPNDPYAGEIYRYKCNREGFVLFSVGSDGEASSNISDGILGDDKGYHEYNEEQ
ncbi:MAG: type II secretion system protein GspG [Anaerovibrio sp.]